MHPDKLLTTPRATEDYESALMAMRERHIADCHRAGVTAPPMQPAAGPSRALPSEHIGPISSSSGERVLLMPVCMIDRPLVLLPAAAGHTLGATVPGGTKREAAVTAVHAAAEAALGEALQGGETFLAGEQDAQRVVLALATKRREAKAICTTPAQLHRRAIQDAATACWCSLDALAGDTRYELAAEAFTRALSFIGPQEPKAARLRTGVGGDAHFARTAADVAESGDGFDARAAAATRSVLELQEALRAAAEDPKRSEHQRECFVGWLDAVRLPPLAEIPRELREAVAKTSGTSLAHVPFTHRPAIHRTEPLPPPPPPPRPSEELLRAQHARDIFEPGQRGYERILRALRRLAKWHRRRQAGKQATRPRPVALDTSVLTPAARAYVDAGGVIDCRDPERIALLDPREQPFQSHLNAQAIGDTFADLPDRELVSMLKGGVTFKTNLTPQIVIMPNLMSLYEEADGGGASLDAVTDALHALVERGWYSTHTSFIPFVPWRCAPRGAVPRPGGGVPRGIVDNGGPRQDLATWPAGELVIPVNESAGPMRPPRDASPSDSVKWHAEGKPQLPDAAGNGAILADIAWRAKLPIYTFAFDFQFYFHQLFLRHGEWWLAGSLMPERLRAGGASDVMVAIVEKVLSMGTSPSSQIAQRFANAIIWALFRKMDALDQPHLESEGPAVREWIAARRSLQHDDYGSHARLYDAQMFTDDPQLQVVGLGRTIRLLAAFHDLVGPDGLGLMYARAAKWQGGVHIKWLGSYLSPALGIAWLARDKAMRALSRLDELKRGQLRIADLAKLEGLLEHFRFVTQLPPPCMYGIRDAHFAADHTRLGPAELARPSARTAGAIARWRHSISNVAGSLLLAAISAEAATPWAGRAIGHAEWHLSSDAALAGTEQPGLGGYMYGRWWCVPLDAALIRLAIVVLELMALAVNVIVFADQLAAAKRIVLEIDALSAQLALKSGGAHSDDLQVVHEEMLKLPELKAIAPRATARHTFGEGNPASDAASRGKRAFLSQLCRRLGVREEELEGSAAHAAGSYGARHHVPRVETDATPCV